MSGPSRSVSVFIDAGVQVKECHVIPSCGQIFFSIPRSRVIHPLFRRNPWLLRSVVSFSFEIVGRLLVNRDRCLVLFSTMDVLRIGMENCVKSKIGPSLSSLRKYLTISKYRLSIRVSLSTLHRIGGSGTAGFFS